MLAEKHILKETSVRLYAPDLAELKAVLRQISTMENVQVALYAKDGEYIVQLAVECGGDAAATQMCDSLCEMIENAQEEQCYARGERTLAHIVAGLLITKSTGLAAANLELGEALEAEFATTNRGESVYDNGVHTYRASGLGKGGTRPNAKTVEQYGIDSLQAATDMAFAASKRDKVKFGAASTAEDAEGRRWATVCYGGKVYARQLKAYASTRELALAVLDLVRRIAQNTDIAPDTRKFTKGHVDPSRTDKQGGKVIVATIIMLIVAAIVAAGVYYYYNIYSVDGNLPADIVSVQSANGN